MLARKKKDRKRSPKRPGEPNRPGFAFSFFLHPISGLLLPLSFRALSAALVLLLAHGIPALPRWSIRHFCRIVNNPYNKNVVYRWENPIASQNDFFYVVVIPNHHRRPTHGR